MLLYVWIVFVDFMTCQHLLNYLMAFFLNGVICKHLLTSGIVKYWLITFESISIYYLLGLNIGPLYLSLEASTSGIDEF